MAIPPAKPRLARAFDQTILLHLHALEQSMRDQLATHMQTTGLKCGHGPVDNSICLTKHEIRLKSDPGGQLVAAGTGPLKVRTHPPPPEGAVCLRDRCVK